MSSKDNISTRAFEYNAYTRQEKHNCILELPLKTDVSGMDNDIEFLNRILLNEKDKELVAIIENKLSEINSELSAEHESLWQDSGSTIE